MHQRKMLEASLAMASSRTSDLPLLLRLLDFHLITLS